MKKKLKNHGKKISVILLAIALMISPLLLSVKAAEECGTHTNVYLFSQAEKLLQKTRKQQQQEESQEIIKHYTKIGYK